MFVGDMEGVHSYVEGICERDGLVSVVEDDMEGVHSSQFLVKNGLMVRAMRSSGEDHQERACEV
ncbi:hypothetical protein Hdeb2414_s0004g00145101 [Helianthus debilis subsp. tardiflorus]